MAINKFKNLSKEDQMAISSIIKDKVTEEVTEAIKRIVEELDNNDCLDEDGYLIGNGVVDDNKTMRFCSFINEEGEFDSNVFLIKITELPDSKGIKKVIDKFTDNYKTEIIALADSSGEVQSYCYKEGENIIKQEYSKDYTSEDYTVEDAYEESGGLFDTLVITDDLEDDYAFAEDTTNAAFDTVKDAAQVIIAKENRKFQMYDLKADLDNDQDDLEL